MHFLQINSPNRVKYSGSNTHSDLCIFGRVKLETVKKIFIISAISLLIILSVGGYFYSVCPKLLPFQITYGISSCAAFLALIDSVSVLGKVHDIFPSCMYRDT